MGIPDIYLYYQASHLLRIADWHSQKHKKDWVELEDSFSLIPIQSTPWLTYSSLQNSLKKHPLIGPTICCFHAANAKHQLIRKHSLLTPFLNNPQFPPGQSPHYLHSINNEIRICILHRMGDSLTLRT